MTQITERVEAHYESSEMPFGKVYEWHNAYVTLECDCGEKVSLTAASTITACRRCGADLATFVHDIRERNGPLPDELTHPWLYDAEERAHQRSTMRLLIPKARPGVTTILREPMRGKPMQAEQTVTEMAEEALSRQAKAHARRTGQSLAEARVAVLGTPAGRQLGELGSGSHQHEEARYWQANLQFERASKRVRQGRTG